MARHRDDPQGGAGPKKRSLFTAAALLTVAVAAALSAAFLLTRYMDARTAAVRVPTEKVVVARVDIPIASPIRQEWLTVVDWPSASKPSGAMTDPAPVLGKVAIVPLSAGEAILPAKLADSGARSGLATLVPASMRAVAVRVNDVVGVAGFIHPGDSVDVIVTMQPRDDAPVLSKIVLENIRVLAVGKDLEHRGRDKEKPAQVTVATLMVTPEESERLALASVEGKILLTLRGIGDEEFVATQGVTPARLLAVAPEPPRPVTAVAEKPRPRPRTTVAPEAPAPKKQVVEILRGDLFEKRDFGGQERKP